MAAEPIKIDVVGKDIAGDALRNTIVQGEEAAQKIEFTLDQMSNGVSLQDANFQMNGLNSRNQSAVGSLAKGTSPIPGKFTLTWSISQQFTASEGRLYLWINAVKSHQASGKTVVDMNWETKPKEVYVQKGFLMGEYVSVTEQLLIDIASMLGRAEQAANSSEASAVRSDESASESANSASEAKSSEVAAALSEANARASETHSKTSEQNAAASEQSAASSASAADASERTASDAANRAQASAVASAGSAATSKTYADSAANSAVAADASATKSEQSAQMAAAQATEAARQMLLSATILRDPTTGMLATVHVIIDHLFALHSLPITAAEFDALNLTAAEFDALMITAYELDTNGKGLLT